MQPITCHVFNSTPRVSTRKLQPPVLRSSNTSFRFEYTVSDQPRAMLETNLLIYEENYPNQLLLNCFELVKLFEVITRSDSPLQYCLLTTSPILPRLSQIFEKKHSSIRFRGKLLKTSITQIWTTPNTFTRFHVSKILSSRGHALRK